MAVTPIVIGALGTVTKRLVQGQEDLKIRALFSIVEIGQITKKNLGDLRRYAVTYTNEKLTLMWKTLKRVGKENNSMAALNV